MRKNAGYVNLPRFPRLVAPPQKFIFPMQSARPFLCKPSSASKSSPWRTQKWQPPLRKAPLRIAAERGTTKHGRPKQGACISRASRSLWACRRYWPVLEQDICFENSLQFSDRLIRFTHRKLVYSKTGNPFPERNMFCISSCGGRAGFRRTVEETARTRQDVHFPHWRTRCIPHTLFFFCVNLDSEKRPL